MQLGLYLPGPFRGPVWRVVSEDSGVLQAPSIALSGTCRLRSWRLRDPAADQSRPLSDVRCEPLPSRSWRTSRRPPASRRANGFRSKKGITRSRSASRSLTTYTKRAIGLAVRLDVATPEPHLNQLENLSPVSVLADMELRHELESDATRAVSLHRDREASFSVDVTRDVAIQSFLLIVRTRHVVTPVYVRPDDMVSSAGYSDIPAYSQIYRQRYPLSHDVLNPARVPL